MENPENKDELDAIPPTDAHGDPIYKIDGDPSEEIINDLQEVPLFLEDNPDTPQGNEQDLKDAESGE